MKKFLISLIPSGILTCIRKSRYKKQIKKWEKDGCPSPPPHGVKQRIIAEYQEKSGYNLLIETGTFRGDMVEAQKKRFKKIISIELGEVLYKDARKRFEKDNHVEIVWGDSGKVLPEIMKNITEPAIFWLDGHYSAGITAKGEKECPIYQEIDAIMQNKQPHILLIDDARCFIGQGDYPAIKELTEYIKSKNEKYTVEVNHDIIRYTVSEK